MTMIERVAEALMTVTREIDCGDLKLKDHYRMARAAIKAMREPTKAMEMAAMDAATSNVGWDLEVYQARIEAALSEG